MHRSRQSSLCLGGALPAMRRGCVSYTLLVLGMKNVRAAQRRAKRHPGTRHIRVITTTSTALHAIATVMYLRLLPDASDEPPNAGLPRSRRRPTSPPPPPKNACPLHGHHYQARTGAPLVGDPPPAVRSGGPSSYRWSDPSGIQRKTLLVCDAMARMAGSLDGVFRSCLLLLVSRVSQKTLLSYGLHRPRTRSEGHK